MQSCNRILIKLLLIYHDNISPAIDEYFVVTTSSVILQLEHFAIIAAICCNVLDFQLYQKSLWFIKSAQMIF